MADVDESASAALRISQLDASELDHEVLQLMKNQILRIFKYHQTNLLSKFDPEISALLKVVIWRFSIFATGATVGQQILSIKYKDVAANQWMTRKQKILLGTILIGCPWLQDRLGVILPFIGLEKYANWLSQTIDHLELATKIASLVNFLVFLRKGCYSSLSERLIGLRSYFPQRQGLRQVSFDFMTRELMWHGFSEFLFFILPLINYQRIKNFVRQCVTTSHSRGDVSRRAISDLQHCLVCGEWPVNPHQIACAHVFCYYCIQSNFQADCNFCCVLCGQNIPSPEDIQPIKMLRTREQ